MIVAMLAVRMMQMSPHYVVHVIPMANSRMSACGTMKVVFGVISALMLWCARGGVGRTNWQDVFIDMIAVDMVQVPIV